MNHESPLVSIGQIAEHLKCSKATAKKVLKEFNVPTFYLGKYISVYPSTLKLFLENVPDGAKSTPEDAN